MAPSPRAPLFRQNLALLCLHPSRHEILHRDDAEYCSGAHRGLPGLRQLLRPHQPGRARPPREAHAARCQRCDLRPDPRRLGMGPAQLPPHGMWYSWYPYALRWATNRSVFAPHRRIPTAGWRATSTSPTTGLTGATWCPSRLGCGRRPRSWAWICCSSTLVGPHD